MIGTMTELARSAAGKTTPLGSSDVFITQAERRAELRRMRTIATLLLVLMAVIFLALRRAPPDWAGRPMSAASPKPAWSGRAPTGSPSSRFFVVPSGCRSPTPRSCRKTSDASARRWGASSPTTFSPHASPSPAVVGRLRRSRGAMARRRRQRAGTAAAVGRAIPYALDVLPKGAIDEWIATAARRGIEAVPAAPLASRGLSILWAQGASQNAARQGLDFVGATLDATRRPSSGMSRKSPRAGSPNGSTT